MTAPNAKRFLLLAALLLIGAVALMSAMAFGYVQPVSDDYGINVGAGMSVTMECEDGYVWAPSPTNIAGQCVPE